MPSHAQASPKRGLHDPDIALYDLQSQVEDVRQQQHNVRTDLEIIEEKLRQLQQRSQATVEALKQQIAKLEGNIQAGHSDSRVAALEKKQQQIIADLRNLSKQAQEHSSLLAKTKTGMEDLDQKLDSSVKNLKSAVQSVLEYAQTSSSTPTVASAPSTTTAKTAPSTYKVAPGDSLEKIAKANNTSVESIKKLNHLKNDNIRVGQVLQMPQKD
jgi:LysM repeat protein